MDSVEPYKNGDVTGDGHLKEEDAEAIKSYINGNKNFTAKQIAAMDINGDKSVTNADYKKCKELIAKLTTDITDTVHFGTIHTVAFDPNKEPGSSEVHGTPESITKYFNVPIKIPDAPYRDGYDFTGYKSDKTDKIYQPGDTYDYAQRGGTDTLISQWKVITYIISFNKNKPQTATYDVLNEMDDVTLTYDVAESLPENKYKLAGWKFVGWNTQPDGSGRHFDDKEVVLNLAPRQDDVVQLYAEWVNINSSTEKDPYSPDNAYDPHKPNTPQPGAEFVDPRNPMATGLSLTYKFTRSDIDNVWKFIEENGIGKTKSDDALKRFVEFIEPLKVTDKMKK